MKNKEIELTCELCEHLSEGGEKFEIETFVVENKKDKKIVWLKPSKQNKFYIFKPVAITCKQLSEFLDSVKIDLYNLCNHNGYIRAMQMRKFSTKPSIKCWGW